MIVHSSRRWEGPWGAQGGLVPRGLRAEPQTEADLGIPCSTLDSSKVNTYTESGPLSGSFRTFVLEGGHGPATLSHESLVLGSRLQGRALLCSLCLFSPFSEVFAV